jgi:hypothetical protein
MMILRCAYPVSAGAYHFIDKASCETTTSGAHLR